MSDRHKDIRGDISVAIDRGESTGLMTPLLIGEDSRHRAALTDLAVELAARAAGFRRSLPEGVRAALADMVRAMNCYYSNVIEGHDTHPIDIERALKNDYSTDARKRDLQLEAKAHIIVQRWIDSGGLKGRTVTADGICEVHRRFGEMLPEDLLWLDDPDTGERDLDTLLNHLPVRCRAFNGDLKLRIRLEVTDQFYYPDCMVFCGPGDQARHWREDPLVLGEVMSASTEDVDRGDKLVAYTTHVPTLQEYILIEQAMMRVEVYRRASGWQKEILGPDDMLRLESIAFEIQMRALYRRVEF